MPDSLYFSSRPGTYHDTSSKRALSCCFPRHSGESLIMRRAVCRDEGTTSLLHQVNNGLEQGHDIYFGGVISNLNKWNVLA